MTPAMMAGNPITNRSVIGNMGTAAKLSAASHADFFHWAWAAALSCVTPC
jgi:hypothetical protein